MISGLCQSPILWSLMSWLISTTKLVVFTQLRGQEVMDHYSRRMNAIAKSTMKYMMRCTPWRGQASHVGISKHEQNLPAIKCFQARCWQWPSGRLRRTRSKLIHMG